MTVFGYSNADAQIGGGAGALREPIAIIGIGCRFPGGADGPNAFWRRLVDGFDAVGEVPSERLDGMRSGTRTTPDPARAPRGGCLTEIDRFDAAFFGMAPHEAARLDPQQRLLLEVAWEALEDAGLPVDRLAGSRTGVFVGLWLGDFEAHVFDDPRQVDLHMTTGSGRYAAAGRLSYAFDLAGPSLVVDTACSSSLVAVHLACRSLWSGESSLALAGGANVILQPHITLAYDRAGMLAADGRCKFGDARADGYVRSEGAGIVVLKPLGAALADGDPIHALILGGAVNNDGRGSGHLVTPAVSGQAALLRLAYADAGVPPAAVRFVEAHGTGTAVGDPAELAALGAVLAEDRAADDPCAVGSLKSNIGHTEGAAGVAGLIKAALALRHRVIPPSLHLRTPNPAVAWADLKLRVPTSAAPMPPAGRLVAGVSAFGITGTNAHLVLASPPETAQPHAGGTAGEGLVRLVPLSARSPDALRQRALDLARLLRPSSHAGAGIDGATGDLEALRAEPPTLADVAFTAATCRTHHDHRLAFVAADAADLAAQLAAVGDAPPAAMGAATAAMPFALDPYAERPKTVFVFPGQGGQWLGMGRGLMHRSPVFREAIARCDAALRPWAAWSLAEQLGLAADAPGCLIDRIEVIQPALVAIGIGLADVLRDWGIVPDAVIGHSLGEVAAAHVAGALDLDDAMRVIAVRSRLMQRLSGQGAMAMLELGAEAAEAALGDLAGRVGVAVINGPAATVVSGDPEAIDALLAALSARGVFGRRVQVDVASHGPQMAPLLPELRAALAGLRPRRGAIPMYSTSRAEVVDGAGCDADYWTSNLGRPVRFGPMVRRLLDDGYTAFVELGPHAVLAPSIREASAATGDGSGFALAAMRRGEDDATALFEVLGELYVRGWSVDWGQVYPSGRRVSLPAYPWQRERHWYQPAPTSARSRATAPGRSSTGNPLLGLRLPNALPTFETVIRPDDLAFAADHRLFGRCVAPVAVYVELAVAAAHAGLGADAAAVSGLALLAPLVVPDDGAVTVQTTLVPDGAGGGTVRIHGSAGDPSMADAGGAWTLHATGTLRPVDAAAPTRPAFEPAEVQARCVAAPVEAGPMPPGGRDPNDPGTGDVLRRLWRRDGEALGWIEIPAALRADISRHRLHPAILDAALRPARAALPGDTIHVVAGIEHVRPAGPLPDAFWSHVEVRSGGDAAPGGGRAGRGRAAIADVRWYDAVGQCVMAMDGLRLHALDAEAAGEEDVEVAARAWRNEDAARTWLYQVVWDPSPVPAPVRDAGAAVTAADHGARRDRAAAAKGSWLVFADRAGLGAAVAGRLRDLGHGAVLVHPGQRYAIRDDGQAATVRRGVADDLRQLMAAAAPDGRPPRGVVFAWGLDAALPADAAPARLIADLAASLGDLAGVARMLAPVAGPEGPRLWVVTQNAQATAEAVASRTGSGPALAQAPLWGLGRVVAIEHPELWGGLIDLADGDAAAQADRVLAEALGTGAGAEDQAVWRDGQRRVPRLVRSAPSPGPSPAWRTDGAHLVSGGLGRVGLAVARWLARAGVRHLVLTGRTGLPDRAAWAALDADSTAARRVARVRDIEALGAEVTVIASDIGDADQVDALAARFGSALPPLRGVWHAAADLGGAAVAALTPEALTEMLQAKVAGAWALHRSTAAADLDAFVLFSSTSALWGARDLAAYAAANGFLDALAHYRRAHGMPALSIDWGIWAEQEGSARAIVADGTRVGLCPMPEEPALDLMGRLVAQDAVQATVAAIDWPTFKAAYTARRPRPFLDRVDAPDGRTDGAPDGRTDHAPATAVPSAPPAFRSLWLNAAPAERHEAAITFVRAAVAGVLGQATPERLDVRRGLFDLGLDSLLAMQLRRRLEAALDRPLSPTVIFSHPSIRALAGFVAALMVEEDASAMPSTALPADAPMAEADSAAMPADALPAAPPAPDAAGDRANDGAAAGLLRRFEATMAAVDDLVGGSRRP